jgi:hypothetical protein
VLNEGPDTTNPADRKRTPGGSAAGSAAAVADFQVPLSLGTQSGGSVIRPASYTGIFAMKPTHNAMSTEGIKVVSWDIDTCGFFARTVEDLELIANIFALEREKNKLEPVPLSAIRVALIETPFFDQAGNGTRAAMSRASEILKEAGVKSIEKVELPFENDNAETLNRIHKTVFGYEAKNAFLVDVRHDKQHELDPKIRKYVEDPKYSNVEMVEALQAYEHMRTDFDKFASKYDAFITPSAVDIAPEGLDDMGASIFNFLWTVSTAESLLLLLLLRLLPLDDLLFLLLLLLLSTIFLTTFPVHSNTSFPSALKSYHSQMYLGLYYPPLPNSYTEPSLTSFIGSPNPCRPCPRLHWRARHASRPLHHIRSIQRRASPPDSRRTQQASHGERWLEN